MSLLFRRLLAVFSLSPSHGSQNLHPTPMVANSGYSPLDSTVDEQILTFTAMSLAESSVIAGTEMGGESALRWAGQQVTSIVMFELFT